MSEEVLKPTLRPVESTELERSVEDRVRELERAVAALCAQPPELALPAGISYSWEWDVRWPTVDELEYFCWVCLALVCGTMALKACPQLIGLAAKVG